ncbi:MAG: hypothetical protein P8N76_25520 [Pirellulaceae bacterium]|nr:hypothetical protein [Pirellulaceae bacterium]
MRSLFALAIFLSVSPVAMAVDTDGDGLLDLMDVPGFDPDAFSSDYADSGV